MTKPTRYSVPDAIRGAALVSMILYHTMWDLVYIFNVNIPWFRTDGAFIWQQSILWTFTLLSGFCVSMGRHKLKRALTVLLCSAVISLVTVIFMPQNLILFGVLSLMGTGMLVTIPTDKLFKKIHPFTGLSLCVLLFALTRNVALGKLNFIDYTLPHWLYANYLTAYLGFPPSDFVSQDYVPVIPWIFLFWAGYFIYRLFERYTLNKLLCAFSVKPLEWLGRHSLIIYMAHQPLVYGVLFVVFKITT